jgi:hypothetical protein
MMAPMVKTQPSLSILIMIGLMAYGTEGFAELSRAKSLDSLDECQTDDCKGLKKWKNWNLLPASRGSSQTKGFKETKALKQWKLLNGGSLEDESFFNFIQARKDAFDFFLKEAPMSGSIEQSIKPEKLTEIGNDGYVTVESLKFALKSNSKVFVYTPEFKNGQFEFKPVIDDDRSQISQELSLEKLNQIITEHTSDPETRKKHFDELMEVIRINGLGSQRGVWAKKDIPRGAFLGIYSGVYTLQKTGEYIKDLVFCTGDLLAEWDWQNKRDGKGYRLMDCYRKGFPIDSQRCIILEGYGHLSPINLINNVCSSVPEGQANVKLYYFMREKELPVAMYFTKKDIKKGTELLSDGTNPLKGKFTRKIRQKKEDLERRVLIALKQIKEQSRLINKEKIRYWQTKFSSGGLEALKKVMNPMEWQHFHKNMILLGGISFGDVDAIQDLKKHLNPMEWECFYRNRITLKGGMDSSLNELTPDLKPKNKKIYDFNGNKLPY